MNETNQNFASVLGRCRRIHVNEFTILIYLYVCGSALNDLQGDKFKYASLLIFCFSLPRVFFFLRFFAMFLFNGVSFMS